MFEAITRMWGGFGTWFVLTTSDIYEVHGREVCWLQACCGMHLAVPTAHVAQAGQRRNLRGLMCGTCACSALQSALQTRCIACF